MTLTCPAAKDPLYQEEYPGTSNVLLLVEGLYDEWFQVRRERRTNIASAGGPHPRQSYELVSPSHPACA